jgi:hypothetical protein
MSIQNLEVPNDLTLYCNILNANTLNIVTESITTLNVDNINEKTLGHGVDFQGGINFSNDGLISWPETDTGEGILLPSSGTTQLLFDTYGQVLISTTMAGIFTSPVPINLVLTVLGNIIYLTFVGGAIGSPVGSSTNITFAAQIPLQLRPTNIVVMPLVFTYGNGSSSIVNMPGYVIIDSSGNILVSKLPASAFENSVNTGFTNNATVSYTNI